MHFTKVLLWLINNIDVYVTKFGNPIQKIYITYVNNGIFEYFN